MALYLAAAIGFGAGWVGEWLDQVQGFGERNLEVNGDLMVSAIGFFQNLFGTGIAAFVVAGAVLIGILALLLPPWWRRGVAPEAVGLAAAGLVLLAPSALYYDAGLLVLSLAIGLTFGYRHAVGFAVGAFIGSWSQLLASTLGFSPLFLLVVVVFVWAAWNERRQTVSPSAVG